METLEVPDDILTEYRRQTEVMGKARAKQAWEDLLFSDSVLFKEGR